MRGLRATLAIAAAGLAMAASAHGAEALSDAELAETRGGFMTPLGLEIGFGASVRTFVDGRLALETQLAWTAAGAETLQVRGEGLPADVRIGSMAAGLPSLTAPGTAILHDLSANRIASVVTNTVNNRTLRQETDLRLYLPQLPALQHQVAAERIAGIVEAAAVHWGGP